MLKEARLYRDMNQICEDYLGPAAPRFLNRLAESHLHKGADEITIHDIPELVTWVRLSISLITDKEDEINEFVSRLQRLAH